MPAVAPYIPAKDADFDAWLNNFATLIQANPTNYGLVAGDATTIDGVRDTWNTDYALAINPTTRTSATVAGKDAARANAEVVVRPYSMRIRNDASVSDPLKVGLGLVIPSTVPTPIPAPTTAPALALRFATPLAMKLAYSDTGAPSGKAKPYGAIGVELRRKIGTSAEVDPNNATYYATVTKSPFTVAFDSADVGKVATFFARFTTRSGPAGIAQIGPWSASLVVNVV